MANSQDPVEGSQEFMMHSFKVLSCPKGYRHNWKRCPFAHEGESERRRDPRVYKYSAVVCPATKKGVECPNGDDCNWAHNVFEYWLHPQRFRTEMCSKKDLCKRRFCFFAHNRYELRDSKVHMEQVFGSKPCQFVPNHANAPAAPLRDHNTSTAGHVGIPSNAEYLGIRGRRENSSMWPADMHGNPLGAQSMQPPFLKHEIHDSLGSLPENIGWGSMASGTSPRDDMQNAHPTSMHTIPQLYVGAQPPPDRLPAAQDMRDQFPSAMGPSRTSPRPTLQNMLVGPPLPSRMSPRPSLEDSMSVGASRFSPRQNAHMALPSSSDRFSPRPVNTDHLMSSLAGWSDAQSSMDSFQDILLASSGVNPATWAFSPLDSVDERTTGRSPFNGAVDQQTMRLLENLDLNNALGPAEASGAGINWTTSEKLLCDHLSFFTDP